jgi:hypothetical protein
MFLCLRIDLDYVPWDTRLADEFGHGEPAMILRLLDFARSSGLKFHFFISTRALRAFPTATDAVLGEGHDLDWLCTDPTLRGLDQAGAEFRLSGHKPVGFGLEREWPQMPTPDWVTQFQFASCLAGSCPEPIQCFPVSLSALRGETSNAWVGRARRLIAETQKSHGHATVCVSPSALGRFDPTLAALREISEFATSAGVPIRTLREAIKGT